MEKNSHAAPSTKHRKTRHGHRHLQQATQNKLYGRPTPTHPESSIGTLDRWLGQAASHYQYTTQPRLSIEVFKQNAQHKGPIQTFKFESLTAFAEATGEAVQQLRFARMRSIYRMLPSPSYDFDEHMTIHVEVYADV